MMGSAIHLNIEGEYGTGPNRVKVQQYPPQSMVKPHGNHSIIEIDP